MILNRRTNIDMDIGAVMKIHHGSPMNSYVKSSRATARDVLADDDSPRGTVGEIVADLS